MRILHVVHQYPPHHIGGTELYTQTLGRYQALSGHSVAVFTPSSQIENIRALQVNLEQGVRVYRMPLEPRSRTRVFRDSFRQQQLKTTFENILRKEEPDIVHLQHLMGLPMALIDAVTAAAIPFVVTLHDYWYVCANAQLLTNTEQAICAGPKASFVNCAQCAFARAGRPNAGWLAPSLAPLMAFRNKRLNDILTKASRIIAPTQFVFRTYAEIGAPTAKIVTVRHGLELPRKELEEARELHSNRQYDGRLKIGYIGGISWQKGIHVLIKAVNKLPADQVLLTIFGDLSSFPDYVHQLQQKIEHPNIVLAGRLPHEQLWKTLAKFDVVIIPTLWYETSSLILDEAFAVGVPVVASRVGVMIEKINEGINGRLFPVGDEDALSQIIMQLTENPDILTRLQAGIPTVRTIEEHVRDIEDVYKDAVVAV